METQAVLFRGGHCSFWLFIGFVDIRHMDSEYTYPLNSTENRQSDDEKVDPGGKTTVFAAFTYKQAQIKGDISFTDLLFKI